MENNTPVPLVDNPFAPEIFASDAAGFLNISGSIVITLEAGKSDYSGESPKITRHVVARLIMPAAAANSLACGLFAYLKSIGFEPSQQGGEAPSVQ